MSALEPIEIGIVISCAMVVLVVLGMRVAFAAAMAGITGLIWIFWAKKGIFWVKNGRPEFSQSPEFFGSKKGYFLPRKCHLLPRK